MRALLCVVATAAALSGSARPPPRPPRGKSKGRSRAQRRGNVNVPSSVPEDESIDAREARLAAKFAAWAKEPPRDEEVVVEKEETPAGAFGGWKKEAKVEPAGGFLLRRPPAAAPAPPAPAPRGERRGAAPKKPAAPARTRAAAKTLADAPPAFAEAEPPSRAAWSDFLGAAAARRLVADGFERPTAAQSALGAALADGAAPRDVLLAAPTGSGKTLAYLLRTLADADGPGGVLVVAPGRELAVQIDRVARRHFPDVSSTAVVGGANRKRQAEALRKAKPALVVGTPGRLAELAFEGSRPLKLGKLRWCVVDECDHALRPPFGEDVEALLGALPRSCGVVFASATGAALLGDEGEAARRARAALRVDATAAGRAGVASGALAAKARHGRLRAKAPLDALRRVLRAAAPACEAALVFVEDAAAAEAVATRLAAAGLDARALVGDAHSTARAAAVRHLNEGAAPAVVVATEGAARGLDCPRVTHVVNYLSAPSSASHYAHRAGRAGRAPATPAYVLSVAGDAAQDRVLDALERDLGVKLHGVELGGGAVRLVEDA